MKRNDVYRAMKGLKSNKGHWGHYSLPCSSSGDSSPQKSAVRLQPFLLSSHQGRLGLVLWLSLRSSRPSFSGAIGSSSIGVWDLFLINFVYRMIFDWIWKQYERRVRCILAPEGIKKVIGMVMVDKSEGIRVRLGFGINWGLKVFGVLVSLWKTILYRLGLGLWGNDGRREDEGPIRVSRSEVIIERSVVYGGRTKRREGLALGKPRIKSGGSEEFSGRRIFLGNGSLDPITQTKFPRIPNETYRTLIYSIPQISKFNPIYLHFTKQGIPN